MEVHSIYVPDEIWEYILSYLPLPSTKRVCKYLYTIETKVNDMRLCRCMSIYDSIGSTIVSRDWYSMRLMLSVHDLTPYVISTITYQVIASGDRGILEVMKRNHPIYPIYCRSDISSFIDYIVRQCLPMIDVYLDSKDGI